MKVGSAHELTGFTYREQYQVIKGFALFEITWTDLDWKPNNFLNDRITGRCNFTNNYND